MLGPLLLDRQDVPESFLVLIQPCFLLAGRGHDQAGFHNGGWVDLVESEQQAACVLAGDRGPRVGEPSE